MARLKRARSRSGASAMASPINGLGVIKSAEVTQGNAKLDVKARIIRPQRHTALECGHGSSRSPFTASASPSVAKACALWGSRLNTRFSSATPSTVRSVTKAITAARCRAATCSAIGREDLAAQDIGLAAPGPQQSGPLFLKHDVLKNGFLGNGLLRSPICRCPTHVATPPRRCAEQQLNGARARIPAYRLPRRNFDGTRAASRQSAPSRDAGSTCRRKERSSPRIRRSPTAKAKLSIPAWSARKRAR